MHPGREPRSSEAPRDAAMPPGVCAGGAAGAGSAGEPDARILPPPADRASAPEPTGWFGHRLVRGEEATLWAVRIGLCAVVVGWIAVLVSLFA